MNKELQEEIEIGKSVEILLGTMAYNSSLPYTYINSSEEKETRKKKLHSRMTLLPMGEVDYIKTLYYVASIAPEFNEFLLTIGIDLNNIECDPKILHSEVVKYLASNDIMFKLDVTEKNWVIDFPEEKVDKLLHSKYSFLIENSQDFINRFYCENFMMHFKKNKDSEPKQLVKA